MTRSFISPSSRHLARSVAFLAVALVGGVAQAQQTDAPDAAARHAGIGIAVGTRNRPYAGLDRDVRVLPLLSYDNPWVRVAGLGADLKLGNAGAVGLGLRLQYTQDGYDTSDSSVFDGMSDRKRSFWLGPSVRWNGDLANVAMNVLGDLSGHSKGLQSTVTVDRTFRAGRLMLTPRVSATWLNDRYVDYYYGVTDAEATATRPAYTPGGTTDVEVGLRTVYVAAQHHLLFLDIDATAFGKQIKDSPLVDRGSKGGVQVGYLYRF